MAQRRGSSSDGGGGGGGGGPGFRQRAHHPQEEFVRNGDRISLFSEQCCGFLSSDGITSTNLVVERLETDDASEKSPNNLSYYPNHFERCVFTVQRIDMFDAQGIGLNADGDPLLYGQVITLRHDYSDTVLYFNRRTQANLAVGCIKVSLERKANVQDRSHHFMILPRYKMRSEGDRVRCTDQILLKPSERDDRYLHVTEIEQYGGMQESFGGMSLSATDSEVKMNECWKYEANISNTPTEWMVHVFDTKAAAQHRDDSIIRVGTPVVLFHKEREGFAAGAHHTEQSVAGSKDAVVYLNIPHRVNQRTYNIEALSFSVNCVWMIERANTTLGGPVMLVPGHPRRPTYRIKHLASHRYLAVVTTDGVTRTTLLSPEEFSQYETPTAGAPAPAPPAPPAPAQQPQPTMGTPIPRNKNNTFGSVCIKGNLEKVSGSTFGSPIMRHGGSDAGSSCDEQHEDEEHNVSYSNGISISVTNPAAQAQSHMEEEDMASPQSAFSATSASPNTVYCNINHQTGAMLHEGGTPPEATHLPSSIPTFQSHRSERRFGGASISSTPNSKPKSPPHQVLSSPPIMGLGDKLMNASSPSGNTPKEISFQIPTVSYLDKKREVERRKKPLDQMKGRAQPPNVTLFYIHPLDEGQTKLHSSTTFTKIQHVVTKRWVQVYGQTSARQNVKQPQKSNFQQALLKKHSLTSQSLKKMHSSSLSQHSDTQTGNDSNPDLSVPVTPHVESTTDPSNASVCDTGEDAAGVSSSEDRTHSNTNMPQYKIVPTEKRAHDDVWCVSRVSQEKLLGLNTVIECRAKLQQYLHHFSVDETLDDDSPSTSNLIIPQAKSKLEHLIIFCSESEVKDPLLRDGLPVANNQELLFSQDIHKLLIRMIQLKASMSEMNIGKLCYVLLRCMIKGSTENATQLFPYINVFKAHISNPVYNVCEMLIELYRDNYAVLKDVDVELVNEIFDHIKGHGMHAACFELLSVLCVCDNVAVPRAQSVVLNAVMANPSILMHTLVSHDNELWVKIPAESVVRGRKSRGSNYGRRSLRMQSFSHLSTSANADLRSPSALSSTTGSERREGSPILSPTHAGGVESACGYGAWVTLEEICSSSNNKLAKFYKATLSMFVNMCKGGFKTALVEVGRWMPQEVLLALVGSSARYWQFGERDSAATNNATMMDIQAVGIYLALEAHIIPWIPSPPQGASRLVVAWHNVTKTTEPTFATQRQYRRDDYPFANSLKRAATMFLSRNTKQVYLNPAKNRLVSGLLTFWQEVIRRNLFDSDELDELLPTITKLMDGSTDVPSDEDDRGFFGNSLLGSGGGRFRGGLASLGLGLGHYQTNQHGYQKMSRFQKHERRQFNEFSEIVMRSKLLAVELFNSRLEHEAAVTQRSLIRGFKDKMKMTDTKLTTPPGTPKKRSDGRALTPEKMLADSILTREDSMSRRDTADFAAHFRRYLQEAVDGRYLRQQNAQLLPVCLDLGSYNSPELTHRVLTFVFKSLWFGAEIAANLQQAQILFSDESWVLFRELLLKKQTLLTMLQNIAQNCADVADEEERCRALLGDLVSLLQPIKTPTQDSNGGTTARERLRRGSFRARRPRKGSTLSRKAGPGTVNHSAVLAERQDIYRNLGFHELIAEKVLTLPLVYTARGKREGLWEIVQLGYLFLKLLCEDHLTNQEAVAVLIVDHLVKHVDKNVGASELATVLYKKNYHLSVTVPQDLIRVLVNQVVEQAGSAAAMEKEPNTLDAANVLGVLLVSEPEVEAGTGPRQQPTIPVPRNQNLCMNFLLEKASALKIHDNLLLYVKMQVLPPAIRGDRLSDAAAYEMQRDSKSPKRNNIVSHTGVLELCRVLEILSWCCQGSNAATELGGQCIVPLPKLLNLVFETLSAVLLDPPPRAVPGSPGISSVASPTLDKEGLSYSPLIDCAEKNAWLPPKQVVSVLIRFLHNVYMHEGQASTDHSGPSMANEARHDMERDQQERVAYEWSLNRVWWSVFVCCILLVKEWKVAIDRASTPQTSSRLGDPPPPPLPKATSAFLSPGSLAPDSPTQGRGGSPPGIARVASQEEEREDTARELIFKEVLPCVATFLTTKFNLALYLKSDVQLIDYVSDFAKGVLAFCTEAVLAKLTQAETSALYVFLVALQTALDFDLCAREQEEEVRSVFFFMDDVETVLAKLRHRDEDEPSPRSQQLTTARQQETAILERFLHVQEYLLETFTEDVRSLNMLLLLLREQMECITEEGFALASRENNEDSIVPQWLTALVAHLEDPELPEQVITGLLKVFTKLIRTASIPIKKIRQAVTGSPIGWRRKEDGFRAQASEASQSPASSLSSPTGELPEPDKSCEGLLDVDDDGDEIELTPNMVQMQNKLNKLGLTSCMVKLTERGDANSSIAHEAICFGIALLHGGNKMVQDSMLDFFLTNDESFFESMKDSITLAVDRLKQRRSEIELFDEHSEPISRSIGSIGQVLRLLQLVCEGHHLRLQNYIRLQDDNLRSTNVVREVLVFLRTLMSTDGLLNLPNSQLGASLNLSSAKSDKEALLQLAQQTFDTLTEFCQGPCTENQNDIVSCNVCGLVDGLLQAAGWQLLELKSKAITTLLSVLEGSSGAGSGALPPSVGAMLKTLKLETVENTLTSIWGLLVKRDDQAGAVFREMDRGQHTKVHVSRPAGAAGAAAVGLLPADTQPNRVYEDEWMENACEVLGVVEHVEKVRASPGEDAGPNIGDLLDVSFNLYILLLTLSSWSPDVTSLLDTLPGARYFKKMVGTIEIARGNTLEKVYFRIPSTCSGLSRQTRHQVLWDLRDKESRAAKLGGFFEVSGELIAEMKYLHHIRSEVQRLYITQDQDDSVMGFTRQAVVYKLGQFFTSPGSQDMLRAWNVRASLVGNAILLFTYSAYEYLDNEFAHNSTAISHYAYGSFLAAPPPRVDPHYVRSNY